MSWNVDIGFNAYKDYFSKDPSTILHALAGNEPQISQEIRQSTHDSFSNNGLSEEELNAKVSNMTESIFKDISDKIKSISAEDILILATRCAKLLIHEHKIDPKNECLLRVQILIESSLKQYEMECQSKWKLPYFNSAYTESQKLLSELKKNDNDDEKFLEAMKLNIETQILKARTPLDSFCTFCAIDPTLRVNKDVPAGLKGSAQLQAEERINELTSHATEYLREITNKKFDSTKKVFSFIADNYDLIAEKFSEDSDLRNSGFAKLDGLITNLYKRGLKQPGDAAQRVRNELYRRVLSPLTETEFRQLLKKEEWMSRDYLRLMMAILGGTDEKNKHYFGWSFIGTKTPRTAMSRVVRIENFKNMCGIIWENRNNKGFESKLRFIFAHFHSEAKSLFWKAILENANTLKDFNEIIDMQKNQLHNELNSSNVNDIIKNEVEFFKNFPIKKYFELKYPDYNASHIKFFRDYGEVQMSIWLFIKSIEKSDLSGLGQAAIFLNAFGKDLVTEVIERLQKTNDLTEEELKIFKDNFEFTGDTIAAQSSSEHNESNPETVKESFKDDQIPTQKQGVAAETLVEKGEMIQEVKLSENIERQIEAPREELDEPLTTPQKVPVDTVNLEPMMQKEDLEFLESFNQRLKSLYEEVKEAPDQLQALLKRLPKTPTEPPNNPILEFEKRLKALGSPAESESPKFSDNHKAI